MAHPAETSASASAQEKKKPVAIDVCATPPRKVILTTELKISAAEAKTPTAFASACRINAWTRSSCSDMQLYCHWDSMNSSGTSRSRLLNNANPNLVAPPILVSKLLESDVALPLGEIPLLNYITVHSAR